MIECPWCLAETSIAADCCPRCGNEVHLTPEEWASRKPVRTSNTNSPYIPELNVA